MPTTAFSSPIPQQQRYGTHGQMEEDMASTSQRYIPSTESSPNQSSSSGTGTDTPGISPIEFACKMTEDLMAKDLNFPSLFKTLFGTEEIGYTTVSGLVDHDYPNVIERGLMPNKLWTVEHQTPLPADLENLANQADVGSVRMGLFPEIFRAWMTIDSDFYLWDFRDGSDLSYYDSLRESVVGITLVPVKKNVFKSSIRHLLCVTTASEILLLGFILVDGGGIRGGPSSPSRSSMEIVSHPIFTLQTEGINFPVITAIQNGRIFLGGQDGSIHEVWYHAGRGWLRDRCGKTNLTRSYISLLWPKFLTISTPDPILDIVTDSRRNILFTLSLSGLIQVYDLGIDGTQFSNVACLPFEVTVNSVISLGKNTLDANCCKSIISIAPIVYGEMNLIAVTDSGVRLYFSCFDRPHQVQVTALTRPSVFKLVHVRLPPGFSPLAPTKRPDNAHRAFCAKGIFSLGCTSNRDKDLLWLITPFPYPSIKYAELSNLHVLPGILHDIKEIPSSDPNAIPLDYPDLVSQHLSWQREMVVLTSSGTLVFRVEKPFELLRDLIVEKKGPENIKQHFYMLPTREHPLTNVLLIAIHPFLFSDNNLHDWAAKSLFLYGDTVQPGRHDIPVGRSLRNTIDSRLDPSLTFDPQINSTQNYAAQQERQESFEFTGFGTPPMQSTFREGSSPSPTFPSSPISQPQGHITQTQSVNFSYTPRHNAIYLIVGRVLLPFWHRKIVSTNVVRNVATRPTKMIVPNISGEEVAYAVSFLSSVYKFLERTPSLYISNVKGKYSYADGPRYGVYDPEKLSLAHLMNFLGLTLEVLGMWQILCDHQFHVVLEGLDESLYNSTMKELVVGGHSAVAIIINSLISRYLGDSTAVDAISLRLREVCPTLFRNEDAIGSKVSEIFTRAKNTNDPLEREVLLKDSLLLSEKVCGQGRFDIKGFCHQFAALGFPLGAVRLCAAAARGVDPNKLALEAFKTQAEPPTEAAFLAYRQRLEYYKIVFEILESYLRQMSKKPAPLTSRKSDESISPDKAKQLVDECIRAILSSDDEAFHITLYNWLMDKRLFDRLLEIQHDYLDSFLKRAADSVVTGKWAADDSGRNDTRILDLLWRHHEMNGNHGAAAHILSKLADSTSTGLNLQQRLEYLSRAVICGKSMGRQGDVLEIYEDKLEVAQIQKLILDSIQIRLGTIAIDSSLVEPGVTEVKLLQDAIVNLNGQLFNISDLFAKFAQPFHLYEAHLELFYSAGHADAPMIQQIWAQIVDSEFQLARGQPKESQMEVLKRKIVTLGRKFMSRPTYFPVENLIEHLETLKSPEIDEGWVFNMMLEIGVPFFQLVCHYERLWKQILLNRERTKVGVDFRLAHVILLMISKFVQDGMEFSGHHIQKNELIEKCTDVIAALIVEFSSRFDVAAIELTHQLNAVKERLDTCH